MSEIRLVGTAHVSAQSVEDVKKAIEEFQPNIVAVELDLGHFHALRKDPREPPSPRCWRSGTSTSF